MSTNANELTGYKRIESTKNSNLTSSEKLEITNDDQSSLKTQSIKSTDLPENSSFSLQIEKDIPITNAEAFTTKKPKNNKIFKANRKGNMLMMLYNKNGEPLIVIGPHWPFTICMMTFIDTITFCYFYFLKNLIPTFVYYLGLLIAIFQILSYIIIFLKNPGIPPKELWMENYFKEKHDLDDVGSYRICNVCKIIMKTNDDTDHCEECNICVIGADHHCPWTSKCIGRNNIKMFYIFLGSTLTLIIYFFVGLFSMVLVENK